MNVLVCGIGRRSRNRTQHQYRFEGRTSESKETPIAGLVALFRPDSVRVLCTGDKDVQDNFQDVKAELELAAEQGGRKIDVEKIDGEIPYDVKGFHELLAKVAAAVPGNASVHFDLTGGIRGTSTAILLAGLLQDAAQAFTLSRLTYVNVEAPREQGVADVVDLTEMIKFPRLAAAIRDLEAGRLDVFFGTVSRLYPGAVQHAANIGTAVAMNRPSQVVSRGGQERLNATITWLSEKARTWPVLTPLTSRSIQVLGELVAPQGEAATACGRHARYTRWQIARGNYVEAILHLMDATKTEVVGSRILRSAEPRRHDGSRMSFADMIDSAKTKMAALPIAEGPAVLESLETGISIRDQLAHPQAIDGPTLAQPGVLEKEARRLQESFEQLCAIVDANFPAP